MQSLQKNFLEVMRDFPNSICSHPYPEKPWNKTLATMVFDLTEGEMHIAFGNACETPFNSYKFEHYYEKQKKVIRGGASHKLSQCDDPSFYLAGDGKENPMFLQGQ